MRGPLMAWAFETYATGDWTIRRLLAELTARGLTTAPGPNTPGKPLSVSHLHTLLRHPYYMGMVRYRGAIYPGKHEPLGDAGDVAEGPRALDRQVPRPARSSASTPTTSREHLLRPMRQLA